MSSADTRRDLENVRQTITDNIDGSQKAIEYRWDEEQTFFAASVAGYNILAGVDQVFALLARDKPGPDRLPSRADDSELNADEHATTTMNARQSPHCGNTPTRGAYPQWTRSA